MKVMKVFANSNATLGLLFVEEVLKEKAQSLTLRIEL
jgi:hypothetical protein